MEVHAQQTATHKVDSLQSLLILLQLLHIGYGIANHVSSPGPQEGGQTALYRPPQNHGSHMFNTRPSLYIHNSKIRKLPRSLSRYLLSFPPRSDADCPSSASASLLSSDDLTRG